MGHQDDLLRARKLPTLSEMTIAWWRRQIEPRTHLLIPTPQQSTSTCPLRHVPSPLARVAAVLLTVSGSSVPEAEHHARCSRRREITRAQPRGNLLPSKMLHGCSVPPLTKFPWVNHQSPPSKRRGEALHANSSINPRQLQGQLAVDNGHHHGRVPSEADTRPFDAVMERTCMPPRSWSLRLVFPSRHITQHTPLGAKRQWQ